MASRSFLLLVGLTLVLGLASLSKADKSLAKGKAQSDTLEEAGSPDGTLLKEEVEVRVVRRTGGNSRRTKKKCKKGRCSKTQTKKRRNKGKKGKKDKKEGRILEKGQGKKHKKGKKNKGNSRKTSIEKAINPRATVNLTCMTTALQLLKFQKDNVNNFLSRHARQQKQGALTAKKLGKKGEYAEPAARLVQAGGGNKSNLSCGGSTESEGAKQLLNLTNMLSECPTLIKAACAPPAINQTFMEDCFKKSTGYNTTLTGCVTTALDGTDACSCFTDAKLVGAMTNLRPCKGKDQAKLASASRTACLNQMRACNGYVDTAGHLQYSCQFTKADILKSLGQASGNNASLSGTLSKVASLTGVGGSSDNSTNSTRMHFDRTARVARSAVQPIDKVKALMNIRGRRAGEATTVSTASTAATSNGTSGTSMTCTDIATIVDACNAIISSSPTSPDVMTICNISASEPITCTAEETILLTSSTVSLVSVQVQFIAFVISLQVELAGISGSQASVTQLQTLSDAAIAGTLDSIVLIIEQALGSTATTVVTQAPSRNRNILRKLVMDRMRN